MAVFPKLYNFADHRTKGPNKRIILADHKISKKQFCEPLNFIFD